MSLKIILTPLRDPTAPPYIDSTFTEDIKSKDPYNNPVYSNDWFDYSPMRVGVKVPLTDNYKLPPHLYWICANVKKLDTDYYSHSKGVILSSVFYELLKQYSCNDCYEVSKITPLSKKLEPISEKKYFLLRFNEFSYLDILDLDNSDRTKRPNKVITQYLYSSFSFKNKDSVPDYFWLKNELVTTELLGNNINERRFKGFKMVFLKEYVEEYLFRDTHPYPTAKDIKERDNIWFK